MFSFCFCFCFSSTRVHTHDLMLAMLTVYHLSHTPNPFDFFRSFSGRVLHFCPGCPRPQASYLCHPCSWDNRYAPPSQPKSSIFYFLVIPNIENRGTGKVKCVVILLLSTWNFISELWINQNWSKAWTTLICPLPCFFAYFVLPTMLVGGWDTGKRQKGKKVKLSPLAA
jgi:hypothetical protein